MNETTNETKKGKKWRKMYFSLHPRTHVLYMLLQGAPAITTATYRVKIWLIEAINQRFNQY